MGRKGSLLVEFLREGLLNEKYQHNLKKGDEDNIIEIYLRRKCKDLGSDSMIILKEWYEKKGHYFNEKIYSKAKQTFKAALRRSIYLEHIKDNKCSLKYKILASKEVEEKRIKRKKQEKHNKGMEISTSSDDESEGYESAAVSPESLIESDLFLNDDGFSGSDSGVDSPSSHQQILSTDEMLAAVHHDHCFSSNTMTQYCPDDKKLNNATDINAEGVDNSLSGINPSDLPLTEAEYKLLLDDLTSDDMLLLEDIFCNKEEPKFRKVMKYWHKTELGETVMLICKIMNEIVVNGDCVDPDVCYIDSDVYEMISSNHIDSTRFENDFMVYFLKPRVSK